MFIVTDFSIPLDYVRFNSQVLKMFSTHTPSIVPHLQTYRTQDLISMAFHTSEYSYERICLDVPQP